MTDIRAITPEEIPLALELYKNSFKVTSEIASRWGSMMVPEHTRAIVADDRVLSMLTIHPFEVWMFGKLVPMGGIGGVATFADEQGKGFAGRLIERAIRDMRDAGQPLSILYPFSFRFYERFGYTLCGDYIAYEAAPSDFASPALDDAIRVRLLRLPDELHLVKQVYNTVAPIWNCMVNRSELHWDRWMEYWTADRRNVYVLEAAHDGEALGYFTVEDVPLEGPHQFEAVVPQVVVSSTAELRAMACFFSRSAASVKRVKLTIPRTEQLWQLFREPRVETRVVPQFQARVVDVVRACELRGYEGDVEADLVFAVDDVYGPWNRGPWRLRVSNGLAEIAPAPEDDEVLVLTIQEFTAIYTGYHKAGDILEDRDRFVEEIEALDDLFFDADTRLLNFF